MEKLPAAASKETAVAEGIPAVLDMKADKCLCIANCRCADLHGAALTNLHMRFPWARSKLLLMTGETVNYESLRERGLVPRKLPGGIKILGSGELMKKVKIEAHAFSEGAKQKLDANKIQYQVIQA